MADAAITVTELALRAKAASVVLAQASLEVRNSAVLAMADALRRHEERILEANAQDIAAGRESGAAENLIDRLRLTPARIEGMAKGLEDLVALPDPVGRVFEERQIEGGINLRRVSVPLGVVAVVFEARPNVTADAAGICLKSANACVLKGGSLAVRSNVAIAQVLREAVATVGLPGDCVCMIQDTDRAAAAELMSLRGIVDVLIPRGGAGLIASCVRDSLVPVIETGTGNCHTYVHATADFDRAISIIKNAKTQRNSVCNACESVLVDEAIASAFLPMLVSSLAQWGVLVHGDDAVVDACANAGLEFGGLIDLIFVP